MMTFVLVLYFSGGSGMAATTNIPRYLTHAECVEAGKLSQTFVERGSRVDFVCLPQSVE